VVRRVSARRSALRVRRSRLVSTGTRGNLAARAQSVQPPARSGPITFAGAARGEGSPAMSPAVQIGRTFRAQAGEGS
jgi:hypothetical protein